MRAFPNRIRSGWARTERSLPGYRRGHELVQEHVQFEQTPQPQCQPYVTESTQPFQADAAQVDPNGFGAGGEDGFSRAIIVTSCMIHHGSANRLAVSGPVEFAHDPSTCHDADPVGGRVEDCGQWRAPDSSRSPKYRVTGQYKRTTVRRRCR